MLMIKDVKDFKLKNANHRGGGGSYRYVILVLVAMCGVHMDIGE